MKSVSNTEFSAQLTYRYTVDVYSELTKKVKGTVLQCSLLSVGPTYLVKNIIHRSVIGPAVDPGVQAVSLQATF